ncbi:MAG: type II toxin-antitoxin system RelE/ParE family toxin [Desulfomicrobium apsheronum]|nr:type II toxin-antitoxin system RelE/ParE family toxin [Desulfomicrobium apsheronum]
MADMETPTPLQVKFFRQDSGREPVREWLKELPQEERKIIGEDIKTVQWGWPLGMPLVRPLGEGLFEVRSRLGNRIARVLFCTHGLQIILLHGFIKKTQRTPADDMKLARKRKAEFDGNS